MTNNNTPQTKPLDETQVKNSEGGYSFELDHWGRLERFLVLGSESGTYYIKESDLTKENYTSLKKCLNEDYKRTINLIVDISDKGRAPKNDPAIFALAVASGHSNKDARAMALENLSKVCRTGTHLFSYIEDVEKFRRWGRSLRTAVSKWYLEKHPNKLAMQLLKYRQRNGWSHKDILRLSHATSKNVQHQALFRWVTQDGNLDARKVLRKSTNGKQYTEYPEINIKNLPELITGFEALQAATTRTAVLNLIRSYDITHEMIPTQWKSDPEVWDALVSRGMPMTALIRNLGVMSSCGLLTIGSNASKKISDQLSNEEFIQKSRLHPMNILVALKTYSQGKGLKGSLTWTVDPTIINALDSAFYKAFKNVKPTGKKFMLALDVSGSMSSSCSGSPISCAEGSMAMTMITARTESDYFAATFSSADGGYWGSDIEPLEIPKEAKLASMVEIARERNWGSTDCSLPIVWALKNNVEVDAFVVYTDSETYAGQIHPQQALKNYRFATGIPAKLIVVGMNSNGFTIADPNDAGSLDVVGFDTAVPQLISSFVKE